jgi:hypothetical protein
MGNSETDMVVKLEAGLNADPTSQIDIQGEKRGTGVCMDVQVLSGNVHWAQTQAHSAHLAKDADPVLW